MSIQTAIHKIWYPRSGARTLTPAALLLASLSLPYRGLIALRNHLYDRGILKTHRLPCPVISVGNITVGGTGKTPTVIMIAEFLIAQGRRPAILSRGYAGASRSPVNIVSDGNIIGMHPRDAGDEPVLMAGKLPGVPVLTGPERYLTGKAALDRYGVDVLILDDAFQHRQLQRDLNILLIDGQSPFGNGLTLPAGPLREPADAMSRADVIVITGVESERPAPKTNVQDHLGKMIPQNIPVFEGGHKAQDLMQKKSGRILPLDGIRGKRICAFTGIAFPEAFRKTLAAAGCSIVSFLAYPDHHRYTEQDICDINDAARSAQADLTVTTEKDGVKLDAFPNLTDDVFLLRIAMQIQGRQDDFAALILTGTASWKKPGQQP